MTDADEDADEDTGIDTVLPTQGFKRVAHMNFIGYVIAIGIALVLLPLLPLVVVVWLLSRWLSPGDQPSYQGPVPE